MNRNIKILLASMIYIIGLIAAVYVGGWIMILKPIRGTITAYTVGTLTLPQLIVAIVKCICSTTVAGFIWCLGYIASNSVYDSRDEL